MDRELSFFKIFNSLSSDASSLPPVQAVNAKRANIMLSHRYIGEKHGDWMASEILRDQLNEYASRVDDRMTINNFATATQELASKLRKDCTGWKSSLPHSGPPNLQVLLSNKHSNGDSPCGTFCTEGLPSNSELEEFKRFMNKSATEQVKARFPTEASSSYSNQFSAKTQRHPLTTTLTPFPPSNDMKQCGFVAKKPRTQFAPSVSVDRNVTHASASDGVSRRPVQPNPSTSIETNNFGPIVGGGIYSTRVGGRFKKWGSKEKDDLPIEMATEEEVLGRFDRSRSRGFARKNNIDRSDDHEEQLPSGLAAFKTAGEQLKIENQKKYGNSQGYNNRNPQSENTTGGYGTGRYNPAKFIKKSLGGKGVVNSRFVSPLMNSNSSSAVKQEYEQQSSGSQENEEVDERLKNIEPRMIELIKNEIMDCGSKITWDDIAGLHFAKTTIQEIVVWPMLRPDIFTGLRRPPKGILLFGPPGTGKTLIGKCIASQSGSTFFSISASSLTSKWIGEGEKMVRALFAVARVHQPSVVFIDEIDSLLSQRSESEHESSRRIKTEFLVQLDGAGTDEEDRLLVIGATNRPQELDEAARRRLVKRLYIPLPDSEARKEMVEQLMKCERNDLTPKDVSELAEFTDGFSGADMKHLCQEACLGPIRSLGPSQISSIAAHQVRPVNMSDFTSALKRVHPSVGPEDLHQYVAWNKTYGSGS